VVLARKGKRFPGTISWPLLGKYACPRSTVVRGFSRGLREANRGWAAGWDPGRGRDASIVDALAGVPGLGPVTVATVRYHRECGVDEAAERFVAATRLRLLPPDQQGVVVDTLRDHLATHPQTRARRTLLFPYLVDGRWCERVPD